MLVNPSRKTLTPAPSISLSIKVSFAESQESRRSVRPEAVSGCRREKAWLKLSKRDTITKIRWLHVMAQYEIRSDYCSAVVDKVGWANMFI
jgi:hypothetical protein